MRQMGVWGTILRRWVVPGVLVTLAVVGVACETSPTPTATLSPSPSPLGGPEEADPTPTPTPGSLGDAKQADATPTATLSPNPSPPDDTKEVDTTPTPTPIPTVGPEEAEALRQLAFDYWAAFNSYNADRVLAYLDEDYRRQVEENIRSDIGRIKFFRVKLGVSEETPPQVVDQGEMEMYLTMKEPLGTRRIRMAFREVAGEWKIIFAEEVK